MHAPTESVVTALSMIEALEADRVDTIHREATLRERLKEQTRSLLELRADFTERAASVRAEREAEARRKAWQAETAERLAAAEAEAWAEHERRAAAIVVEARREADALGPSPRARLFGAGTWLAVGAAVLALFASRADAWELRRSLADGELMAAQADAELERARHGAHESLVAGAGQRVEELEAELALAATHNAARHVSDAIEAAAIAEAEAEAAKRRAKWKARSKSKSRAKSSAKSNAKTTPKAPEPKSNHRPLDLGNIGSDPLSGL